MRLTMASPARPTWAVWSTGYSTLIVALTAIGLVGAVIDLVGLLAANPPHGCAAGVGLAAMVGMMAIVLVGLSLVGVLAVVGTIFLFLRSRWGPLLMLPANLLTMGFFGWWTPVNPGQLAWAAIVVLLTAPPALAVALLVVQLLSRDSLRERLIEVVLLGALAIPLGWLYVAGMAYDVSAGLQQPPAPVVASSSGGGC
jgi:hypothetical protein